MTSHEYQSRPVTITAVQIADDVDTTSARIDEAFGTAAHEVLTIAGDYGSEPHRLDSVTMTTLQGALAVAKPGEWIAQESDPDRFYPIADAAMRARYKVPASGRGVSVVIDGTEPQSMRDVLR